MMTTCADTRCASSPTAPSAVVTSWTMTGSLDNDWKSRRCTACGFVYYYNPAAATVALVTDGCGRLLVTTRACDPARGTLDLPGGFVDMGETAEEGVAREVMEETSLRVSGSRYLFSLPNRYLYSGLVVSTLDMFFACRVDDLSPLAAHDDAAAARFVPLGSIDPADFGLESIRRGLQLVIAGGMLQ